MPELPDVEIFKRYLDATALHQKIVDIEVRANRMLKDILPKNFKDALKGKRFESTRRHGKYLFVELEKKHMLIHFGMTGRLKYFKKASDDPEYDQVLFRFADGYHLACISKRKLGKIGLIDSPDAFIEEKGLGPDALSIDLPELADILEKAKSFIKSLLMNQRRIAGIGNIYSDEILFRARLHPRKKSDRLKEPDVKRLDRAIETVLHTAIDRKAKPDDLPTSYLIPHRGKNGKCPRCGGDIKRIEVSGRNGWYCSRCQKK